MSETPYAGGLSRTKFELSNRRISTAEEAVAVIGRRSDQLVQHQTAYLMLSEDMSRGMRATDCPFKQDRLDLVHLHAMSCYVSLRLPEGELPACELLSIVLEADGVKRSYVVDRRMHEGLVLSACTRQAAWT